MVVGVDHLILHLDVERYFFFTSRNGLAFLKFEIMYFYDLSIEIARCQCPRGPRLILLQLQSN